MPHYEKTSPWGLNSFSCLIYIRMKFQLLIKMKILTFTVKPVLSGHSKRTPKIGFKYWLSPNAGQKYCRMLQGEHSAILLTFIKLPIVIKIFVLSFFEWPLKTGFTVGFFMLLYMQIFFFIYHAYNVKMPTIVGILIFMSRINFMLS